MQFKEQLPWNIHSLAHFELLDTFSTSHYSTKLTFGGQQQQCRGNSFPARNSLLSLITVSVCMKGLFDWCVIFTDQTMWLAGPAVKVPGLVFCAGQTATGEIKQATVRLSCPRGFYSFFQWPSLTSFAHREPLYKTSRKSSSLQDRPSNRLSSTMSTSLT